MGLSQDALKNYIKHSFYGKFLQVMNDFNYFYMEFNRKISHKVSKIIT
jgi:hypothetical protein